MARDARIAHDINDFVIYVCRHNSRQSQPSRLCGDAPQWTLFFGGTTAVGQSCFTAYQNLVQLGAVPRCNPAYANLERAGLLQLGGTGQAFLYVLLNGEPYGKVVYATSANGCNDWNSVIQGEVGKPLNPTGAVVGSSVASGAANAGAFLSWAGFEANSYLVASSDGIHFGASASFTPLGGASITPAAVAPGNPGPSVFLNGLGTALVSTDQGGGDFTSCTVVPPYQGVAIGDLAAAPTSTGGVLGVIDTAGNMSWVNYS